MADDDDSARTKNYPFRMRSSRIENLKQRAEVRLGPSGWASVAGGAAVTSNWLW